MSILDPPAKLRFIPACAGNIVESLTTGFDSTVHPRVCGEHPRPSLDCFHGIGSSPRVRGTFFDPAVMLVEFRFIPACAGNINTWKIEYGLNPVHPRVCGEHICSSGHNIKKNGSSPRVRGTYSRRS